MGAPDAPERPPKNSTAHCGAARRGQRVRKPSFVPALVFEERVVILLLGPLLGLVGPVAYVMLCSLLTLFLCLLAYTRQWLYPGTRLEAMVEGNLFLAGLLGLVWQILR